MKSAPVAWKSSRELSPAEAGQQDGPPPPSPSDPGSTAPGSLLPSGLQSLFEVPLRPDPAAELPASSPHSPLRYFLPTSFQFSQPLLLVHRGLGMIGLPPSDPQLPLPSLTLSSTSPDARAAEATVAHLLSLAPLCPLPWVPCLSQPRSPRESVLFSPDTKARQGCFTCGCAAARCPA